MVLQYHVIEAVSSMYCVLYPRVLQSERAAIYSSCHCLDHSSFVLVWLAAPHGAVGKLTRSKLENGHCYLVINAKKLPQAFCFSFLLQRDVFSVSASRDVPEQATKNTAYLRRDKAESL